ncbi:hypothetical protein PanWU01x14_150600 [Parasponia andersonii]|uniref:Zinc finger, PMZ-type n=1 Tax=Parasponia andersonii TaxID=3476 RepID=A0A2P5CIA7_PARAD|nr:hypothetical protein PanWU01x14_150600 [Parasponia andersonii]
MALGDKLANMSFEVELNDTNVGVKLDEQVCDYGNWKLKGVPYIHALACFNTIWDTRVSGATAESEREVQAMFYNGDDELLQSQITQD